MGIEVLTSDCTTLYPKLMVNINVPKVVILATGERDGKLAGICLRSDNWEEEFHFFSNYSADVFTPLVGDLTLRNK